MSKRQRNKLGRFNSIKLPTKQIINSYLNGISENALAKQYSVSRGVIRNRLEIAGINPRGRRESQLLKWKQMTQEQREYMVKAAHDATRGRDVALKERKKRALSKQENFSYSPLEQKFADLFNGFNVKFVPQYALEMYNLDFAFPQIKIAIEIDGGGWHNSIKKRKYDNGKEVLLSNKGWEFIRIKINRGKITITTSGQSKNIINILQIICSNPTIWSKNRMISG